jgi:putative membrane protein
MMTITFAFLHHVAFVVMFVTLSAEMILLRQPLTVENARRLQIYDAVYGAAAVAVLIIGGLRVYFFEKGWYYYLTNHAFLTKIAIYIVVGVLSAIPTIEFMRWRKETSAGRAPQIDEAKLQRIRKIVHWELVGLMLMLFFAAWMARGAFR